MANITKDLTVYEALQEKKLLEKRISGIEPSKTLFVTYAGITDEQISGVPMDKALASIKGNYDSISHLIKNLAAYTAAISQSNALTKVTIDGKDYTVAEAISRYNNIDVEKKFLSSLLSQYNATKATIDKHNREVSDPVKIANYLNSVLGDKRTSTQIDEATKTYLDKNLWIIVDPNELTENIIRLCDELNSFKEKFHFILTQSNAITNVTVILEN